MSSLDEALKNAPAGAKTIMCLMYIAKAVGAEQLTTEQIVAGVEALEQILVEQYGVEA